MKKLHLWLLAFVFIFAAGFTDYGNRTMLTDPAGNLIASEPDDNGDDYYLSVHTEHPHHRMLNHYFTQATAVTDTTNGVAAVDAVTIVLDDATGFAANDNIDIQSDGTHIHMYRKIISIATNTLTIGSGVDVAIPDGSTVTKHLFNMAVDGSSTPQVFSVDLPSTDEVDINRILIQMVDNVAGDDSLFGGIAALTNGVHLRKNINNGASYQTVAIWRANKDLKEDMFDVVYTAKAGGGNHGTSGRWTFIETGAIVNLEGADNESFELVVQDDLTGLIDFQMKAQGHFE